MNVTLAPGPLEGEIRAIPSKSHVHRLLLGAGLSASESTIPCRGTSRDIQATVGCLRALGADIREEGEGFRIRPIPRGDSREAELPAGESGSTYRFLAPVVCALGRTARFCLCGELPNRPMEELWQVLEAHGAVISGKGTPCVRVSGPLTAGTYAVRADISSQFITGLLYALPLLREPSEIVTQGHAVSRGYIRMTLDALACFGVEIKETPTGYSIPGGPMWTPPESPAPEGDWSNAAFWLCAGAVNGRGITLTGLSRDSSQGDRAVLEILRRFGAEVHTQADAVTVKPGTLRAVTVDAEDIPDLVPALAVTACAAAGTSVFARCGRLRLKESDRLRAITDVILSLGGVAEIDGDTLRIHGAGCLAGGAADAGNDHRIAMLASVASALCRGPVTVTGAQAVGKSYPGFYRDLALLGGRIIKEEGYP